MAKRITVIGTGYVGLVSSVGLADFGNYVTGVDISESVVKQLNEGKPHIYEHGLAEYLARNLEAGRLSFSTDVETTIREAEIVFLAVGTPSTADGGADLSQIEQAVATIARNLDGFKVIVTKSTVPVGTNRWIKNQLHEKTGGDNFAVVSNPEFLREGKAVQDFFHPDRIVIGYEKPAAREYMEDVYRALYLIQTPIVWCNLETAELIKYASNAFLATKITFINQMAHLAEATGADIHQIAKSMGMDGRISPKFLHPGPGYGGSCFPKDTKAVASTGDEYGVDMSLIKEVIQANERQKVWIADKLAFLTGGLAGTVVGVLGLAFKAETDDIRESPSITIAERLLERGATVQVHDPKAMENFRILFGDRITYAESEFDAVSGAHATVILTEWNEYRNLDLDRTKKLMVGNIILDTRNVLDPDRAKSLGFVYSGVGR
ncbi:MAG: UDP-glucose dehydrogenase family protein [Spirochaetaceae bacterium]